MKALFLFAAALSGSLASAQVKGYKCMGVTDDQYATAVMIKGAFDLGSMTHKGNLYILGTDSPTRSDSSSFLGGSVIDPRFFPGNQITVEFDEDELRLSMDGETDNGSTIKVRFTEGKSGNFFKPDLAQNTAKGFGPYSHIFRKANCKFQDGPFPKNDFSFPYKGRPPQWPY